MIRQIERTYKVMHHIYIDSIATLFNLCRWILSSCQFNFSPDLPFG